MVCPLWVAKAILSQFLSLKKRPRVPVFVPLTGRRLRLCLTYAIGAAWRPAGRADGSASAWQLRGCSRGELTFEAIGVKARKGLRTAGRTYD
jgi:hypothetical protein